MKLLFDQNLPPRLTKTLEDIFPDSIHVREIGFVEEDFERDLQTIAKIK